ncbi:hypothetical protein MPH_02619 [Macrophomina phaseolina MS6]|uniref:Uncharacterized protein n=1 Tax=Macrophomina phaseolina (strain MS6) TaxID=1126212 RepID=K2STQ1_MACPH|nr:hypothetical protein MPH_02619 [Macrophomina phaseolina MS6]
MKERCIRYSGGARVLGRSVWRWGGWRGGRGVASFGGIRSCGCRWRRSWVRGSCHARGRLRRVRRRWRRGRLGASWSMGRCAGSCKRDLSGELTVKMLREELDICADRWSTQTFGSGTTKEQSLETGRLPRRKRPRETDKASCYRHLKELLLDFRQPRWRRRAHSDVQGGVISRLQTDPLWYQ